MLYIGEAKMISLFVGADRNLGIPSQPGPDLFLKGTVDSMVALGII